MEAEEEESSFSEQVFAADSLQPSQSRAKTGGLPCGPRHGARPERTNEEFEVYAGRNEPVLDLLAPQSAPARALRAMRISRLCETAFHQMATAAVVPPRLRTAGLGSRGQDQVVLKVAIEFATVF